MAKWTPETRWYHRNADVVVLKGPLVAGGDAPETVSLPVEYHTDIAGLCMHKDPYSKYWTVTHALSGLAVVQDISDHREAQQVLVGLGQLAKACNGTWDVPTKILTKNKCLATQASALAAKYRAARRGVLMQICARGGR